MYRWKKYVPVGDRIAKGMKKINKLKKSGKKIEPIQIEGRKIAHKFWGKKWCDHLESFADYSNRLPRGRSYVRNGSVGHLAIKNGYVEAYVCGSSLYSVEITIDNLSHKKWQSLKNKCQGQVGSLLELLTGKMSDNVMEVVADDKEGLFPNPGEIEFSCDCPDWADMCKHVSAVLYGIGRRLDEQPELLFLLRGVDASELVTTELVTTTIKTDDVLEDEGLSDIFGIDFEEGESVESPINIETITGTQLKMARLKLELSVAEFAEDLEVTPATIYRWEKIEGPLKLKAESRACIEILLGL